MARKPERPQPPREAAGRFAYDGLERAIHERARLGIMTSLVAHPQGLRFGDLKALCELTDGNLNRHLKVLQESGLVFVRKEATGTRPQSVCAVTTAGRRRFLEYLAALEQVVSDAARAAQSPAEGRFSPA